MDYLLNINNLDTSNIKLIICPSTKHLASFKNSNCIIGSQDIENNNLEYLKNFAEFEEIKGKVKITKVLEPNYINPRNKENNNQAY